MCWRRPSKAHSLARHTRLEAALNGGWPDSGCGVHLIEEFSSIPVGGVELEGFLQLGDRTRLVTGAEPGYGEIHTRSGVSWGFEQSPFPETYGLVRVAVLDAICAKVH